MKKSNSMYNWNCNYSELNIFSIDKVYWMRWTRREKYILIRKSFHYLFLSLVHVTQQKSERKEGKGWTSWIKLHSRGLLLSARKLKIRRNEVYQPVSISISKSTDEKRKREKSELSIPFSFEFWLTSIRDKNWRASFLE